MSPEKAPNDKGFLPFPAGTWREMGFTTPGKRTIAGRRARTRGGFVCKRVCRAAAPQPSSLLCPRLGGERPGCSRDVPCIPGIPRNIWLCNSVCLLTGVGAPSVPLRSRLLGCPAPARSNWLILGIVGKT